MSIAENKLNMEGYLVGYGIIHKDGTEEYHTLEKPIHNKIVKSGINQLLMYNWQTHGGYYVLNNYWIWNEGNLGNFQYPIFYGTIQDPFSNTNKHYGCLHFCRRGTNGDATDFFDEDLKSPIGDYTTTLKTSNPYTLTKAIAWNKYSITISHIHEPETQPVTIQEIGYFGKSTIDADNWAYHMFSRIVLDQPVKLDEGEQLITSYCLVCTVDDTVQHLENFGGISGVYADARYSPYLTDINRLDSCDWSNLDRGNFPFPGVRENGATYYPYGQGQYGAPYGTPNRAFMFPQVYLDRWIDHDGYGSQASYNPKENIVYGTTSSINLPAYNDSTMTNMYSTQQMTPKSTYEFVDYDMTKNYRDIKLIMPVWNPDLTLDGTSAVDMYYIRARGMDYRLGHTVTTETSNEWIPTPITKYVNHKMTFTVRTTISTEDTDLLNGNLVPPEP